MVDSVFILLTFKFARGLNLKNLTYNLWTNSWPEPGNRPVNNINDLITSQ